MGIGLMGDFHFHRWASLKQTGLTYITRKNTLHTTGMCTYTLYNFLQRLKFRNRITVYYDYPIQLCTG